MLKKWFNKIVKPKTVDEKVDEVLDKVVRPKIEPEEKKEVVEKTSYSDEVLKRIQERKAKIDKIRKDY